MASEADMQRIQQLEQRIQQHADSISQLKIELSSLKNQHADQSTESQLSGWPLSQDEYKRYGRQLIMPEVGMPGQLRLKHAAVLLVGAGGLGCPAAVYLAGAGVGTLGVVDGDVVEESNLHRQILHGGKVGMNKAESAVLSLRQLNPLIKYNAYTSHLSTSTAGSIFSNYDLVLDCTDNPASRYLISDTCVLFTKPLVSASALRTEGQLSILNHPARMPGDALGGPCYRCIFPVPPPADSITSCSDGGILGPVVGTMGVLQALEAIKLLSSGECAIAALPAARLVGTAPAAPSKAPAMLLFSAYQDGQFRSIRLRRRNPKCAVCSANAHITLATLTTGSLDYTYFCSATSTSTRPNDQDSTHPDTSSAQPARISATDFAHSVQRAGVPRVLLDTREPVQFALCHLPGSINVPLSSAPCSGYESAVQVDAFVARVQNVIDARVADREVVVAGGSNCSGDLSVTAAKVPIYVVCRLGNDSQLLVQRLKQLGFDEAGTREVRDIVGGLRAWTRDVDSEFPEY